MFAVRQPISSTTRFALGVVSILLLVAGYTYLSHAKAEAKRDAAAEQIPRIQSELEAAKEQQTHKPDSTLQGRIVQLERQIKKLQQDRVSAVDRTMPTWSSLFHDGLVRVLSPQGLNKDEYWLWEDSYATAFRLVCGLVTGVLLSIVIGILMGSFSACEAFFVAPLSFLAKIPPTAMLPVFFVLSSSISLKMYVTIIAFGTVPTLAQAIYQSAKKDVPENLVYKAYTLGASNAELVWNVIFKQVMPRLIDAVRLQIGPVMVLLVAAEWVVASEGFGYRLRLFYQRVDMSVIYLYLIILGAAGYTFDYLLILLRRKVCPWFGE